MVTVANDQEVIILRTIKRPTKTPRRYDRVLNYNASSKLTTNDNQDRYTGYVKRIRDFQLTSINNFNHTSLLINENINGGTKFSMDRSFTNS